MADRVTELRHADRYSGRGLNALAGARASRSPIAVAYGVCPDCDRRDWSWLLCKASGFRHAHRTSYAALSRGQDTAGVIAPAANPDRVREAACLAQPYPHLKSSCHRDRCGPAAID